MARYSQRHRKSGGQRDDEFKARDANDKFDKDKHTKENYRGRCLRASKRQESRGRPGRAGDAEPKYVTGAGTWMSGAGAG